MRDFEVVQKTRSRVFQYTPDRGLFLILIHEAEKIKWADLGIKRRGTPSFWNRDEKWGTEVQVDKTL